MSKTAYFVLSLSVTFTGGVIYYVHKSQKEDRERLREGVIFDLDRQQRKLHNTQQLALQADLANFLKEQSQQNENIYRPKLEDQTLR